MEAHFTQGKLISRNGDLDIHHKRKVNYEGEEREAKKSKFQSGAEDGTSKPCKITADEGLGSSKATNDVTEKSTLELMEEVMKDPRMYHPVGWDSDDVEEDENLPYGYYRKLPRDPLAEIAVLEARLAKSFYPWWFR